MRALGKLLAGDAFARVGAAGFQGFGQGRLGVPSFRSCLRSRCTWRVSDELFVRDQPREEDHDHEVDDAYAFRLLALGLRLFRGGPGDHWPASGSASRAAFRRADLASRSFGLPPKIKLHI